MSETTIRISDVISKLSELLFKAEYRRLDTEVTRIDQLNREHQKLAYKGFVYAGQLYMPKNTDIIQQGPKPMLSWELTQTMEDFLADKRVIERDKKTIEMMLYKLLRDCDGAQQIRDALPEVLVSLTSLGNYTRTREAAYTISGDERAERELSMVLPKIAFYSATRLLY